LQKTAADMADEELLNNRVGKNTNADSALSFEALRAKGIELIQAYSGHAWTDFNLHDPGVTILEYLSYAITDLAYRTNFPIKDLLTDPQGRIDAARNLFFSRRDILATSPVTVNDLRKLIIDQVPSVYNVWLEKIYSNQSAGYIKGLYRVTIQLFDDDAEGNIVVSENEETLAAKKNAAEEEAIEKVKSIVFSHRNIGEDYIDFTVLKPCIIEIESDIVIERHAISEEVLSDIYIVIQNTLNPVIRFYSETDLLEMGIAMEEMYSGPALENGFLLDAELDAKIKSMDPSDLLKSTRPRVIDPSDIMKAIASIPGVYFVRDFKIKSDGDYKNTLFRLASDQYASFRFIKDRRTIQLSTETNELIIRESLFNSILHKKLDAVNRKFIKNMHETDDPALHKGNFLQPGHYFSFQQLFPPAYRLNTDRIEDVKSRLGITDNADAASNAKSKQLKAYLMFFEQVLANYLSQLAGIDRLLTADLPDDAATYFSQPLYEVPGAGNILKDFYIEEPEMTDIYWSEFKTNPDNGYRIFLNDHSETDEVFKARKNKILDHLISRFNLSLKKYPVVFFEQLYLTGRSEEKLNAELRWKSGILKDMVLLTRNRSQAFNYAEPGFISAGFETLISRLLFIQNMTTRKLSDSFETYVDSFRLQERDFYVAKSDKQTSTVSADWLKTSDNEVLVTEESVIEGASEGVGAAAAAFTSQPVGFLKDGLDARNYRIGPNIDNNGFMLLYKPQAAAKWMRVGVFEDWHTANSFLSHIIDTLRKINIESEGFHIVEHILLRPSLDNKCFGFNFYDEKGNVLFYQNHWTDFMDREKILEDILSVADGDVAVDYAAIADQLNHKCWINQWNHDVLVKSHGSLALYKSDPLLAAKLFDKLIRCIKDFRKKRMTVYPGIENMVTRYHDGDIREDFFHFRMTVVLPAWPARFQDAGFRQFVEGLFREYAPVHMKLQFKWLGISKMKKFETIYFDWRETMQHSHQSANDLLKADRLISFVNNGIYSIM
jgi:hypothetical protein